MNNNNCTAYVSLRTADTFLVVASLPLKNSYFWRERKIAIFRRERLEMRVLFAG